MLIVADSSPLIVLINIGQVGLLPELFGEVVIPPAVAEELRADKRPPAVQAFIAAPPGWLIERVPAVVEPIPALHPGELAAISLAMELKADLLLIDDSRAGKLPPVARFHSPAQLECLSWLPTEGYLTCATPLNA
ncbi:MAG TPA: hypothetical protein PK867_03900 [Pirellulales bacterium]|nr:hypothetical protein [Pirellulales bacterium]